MIVRMVEAATLLLLAGGQSRRMGQPKALLSVRGITLIEWMAGRLAPGFDQLLVSAGDERQLPESLRAHLVRTQADRKSTRLNSSHSQISYAVFCWNKKNTL